VHAEHLRRAFHRNELVHAPILANIGSEINNPEPT
jgi:hypothetical protein